MMLLRTVLLLSCVALPALGHQSHDSRSAAYVWSNAAASVGTKPTQVSYETIQSESIVAGVLDVEKKLASTKALELLPQAADIAVAYVSCKKLHSKDSETLAKLVQGAPSSFAFVNAQQGVNHEPLATAVTDLLHQSGASVQVHGCNGDAADLKNIVFAAAGKQALLVCSSCSDNDVEEVEQLQQQLVASGKSYTLVYAAAPAAPATKSRVLPTHSRSLSQLAGIGPYTVCDSACQTQVRWLEGMLAGLLMLMAVSSGLCCLYMLESPSKFEAPKEGQ